ncbi:MAG: 4'-phosphopantetheinyl transferase superfamily protein [Anaerolineales bacterium]|jgi:4'-phosphopantetheinyl transferase
MKIKHWSDYPKNSFPTSSDCHMWLAWLDEEDPAPFRSILSSDEKLRAERLCSPKGADRFTVARGILRTLLGHFRSCNPERLAFAYGPHGKPELADEMGDGISFNVSHSGNLAVFAIAYGCEVGVDIEEFRPISDLEATASIFLSSDEFSQYQTIPTERKLERFFNLWTSKEAILKAYGIGFSGPAKDIFTKFQEPGPNIFGQNDVFDDTRLRLFDPAEGFRGALACL